MIARRLRLEAEMMETRSHMSKYRCPKCDFQIFNRRVSKCESCHSPLPAELLLTTQEKAALDAEHEKNAKKRAEEARKEKNKSNNGGGEGLIGGGIIEP